MSKRPALRAVLLPVLCVALLGFVFLGDSPSAKPKHRASSGGGDVYLGVVTQTVDKELAKSFKLSTDRGAVINEVEDESPAQKAGFKEDDVITAINGHEIYDEDDLVDEIQAFDAGDRIKVSLVRDGKPMTLEPELAERDDSDIASLQQLSRLDELRELANNKIAMLGGRTPRAYTLEGDALRELTNSGYIGISYTDLTTQLAEHFGITGSGALVTEVVKRTPAEKAGIKAGDIITKVDDEELSRRSSLSGLISDYHAGDTANLTVIRDKKSMVLPVIVDARSDNFGFLAPQALSQTLRGSSRQLDAARRELDAARRLTDRTRGLRYGDDKDVPNTDELEARIKDLELQLEKLNEEMKTLRK